MAGNPYIKLKIGEHDLLSPGTYCGRARCERMREFCPLCGLDESNGQPKAVTWATVEDDRQNGLEKPEARSVKPIEAERSSIWNMEGLDGISGIEREQLEAEIRAGAFTCWGDGSGFEYDLMSRNVIGPPGLNWHVYDITNYEVGHKAMRFSEWNAWIEKFQYDYRYGRVSDMNAECVLFPNVDNPWMFTEYVYRGIGGDNSGKTDATVPDEYVVEPPVYDPSTLRILNGDSEVTVSGKNYDVYKEKYADMYPSHEWYDAVSDGGVAYRKCSVRTHRKVEGWDALFRFTDAEKLEILEKQTKSSGGGGGSSSSSAGPSIDDFPEPPAMPAVSGAGTLLYEAKLPVQSVKWGEHGNVPPLTIDMMAPSDWMDPTASVSKIRSRYVAHVGTPFYAPCDGIVHWYGGKQAYIKGDVEYEERAVGADGKKRYDYGTTSGDEGYKVPMPYKWENGSERILKPFERVMGVSGTDDLCHGGCAMCSGGGGLLRCGYIEGLPESDPAALSRANSYFDASKCASASDDGHGCPHYVKAVRRHPLIATYQTDVISSNQTSNNMANITRIGMAGALAGGAIGAVAAAQGVATGLAGEMDKMYQQYKNLGKYGEADVTYELKYEVVHAAPSPARLNKKKYNEFGKGVQIVPGTGKYALDSEKNANVFQGGDTNTYDDVSTLSFGRFFRSVMPCAKQAHCHAFASVDQSDGWSAGVKAGGDGKCRYHCGDGGMGCPYNGVPKRAVEFAQTASAVAGVAGLIRGSYEALTGYGCWEVAAGYLYKDTARRYRKTTTSDGTASLTWVVVDESWMVAQESGSVAVVAMKIDDSKVESNVACSDKIGGAALKADGALPAGYAKAFKFRTRKSTKTVMNRPWYENVPGKQYGNVILSVYEVLDAFYWFKPLYNGGGAVSANKAKDGDDSVYLPALEQHVDKDGMWLCKVYSNYVPPSGGCWIVENERKFTGGWHPEYKDYSKLGSEFMQDIVSDASREGQAMGDYVQNGDYTPIPQAVNKKGYWIDRDGLYITDERDIGTMTAIAGNDDRESNSGLSPCISFSKTNSELDAETGKRKQPKVDHGAVFANDPYRLVCVDYSGKNDGPDAPSGKKRPEFDDPERNSKYVAPCVVNDPLMLPTMRHALHCPNCDYYIHIRYAGENDGKCPWCGEDLEVIHGSDGSGFGTEEYVAEGKVWAIDDENASVMEKFFKLYSIGMVSVWAPPGTSIPTDMFFWRHQAPIRNAVRRQIYHRLGDPGTLSSGLSGGGRVGYQFNRMSSIGEMTMGYPPEGVGAFMPVPQDKANDHDTAERYNAGKIDWDSSEQTALTGMYNPAMPRHMVPALYPDRDGGLEDEGVIAPYTKSSNDALKIASLDQIRVIRNAVEPMYAYVSDPPMAGEFPTLRASYDQREMQDQPVIFRGRRSVIRPVVLARTDDGRDSYQAYYSGDMVYGNVREYFPSGYTWWYMKQVLGGRVTTHQGGRFHMDDNSFADNPSLGIMQGGSGGEYTVGNKTVAKCAVSLYGVLPLDKDIVKAYVIVHPSGVDPSKNPVGRSWTGGPEMPYHYHAKTVDHYRDGKDYHLHGTAGYPNEEYFDENGKHICPHPPGWSAPLTPNDESAYRLWGVHGHSVDDDRFMYYEDTFGRTMADLPGLHDVAFYRNVGAPKGAVMSDDGSEEIGSGYSESSFALSDGFVTYNIRTDSKRAMKYRYVVVDADGDLVLPYPDSAVWRDKTAGEIQQVIDRNTCEVEFSVSDGTEQGTVSYVFTETDAEVYEDEAPAQSQAISGYFDMSWTNTRGYLTGAVAVDAKASGKIWSHPVIFQDDWGVSNGSGGLYTGGENSANTGKTARVIDVTSIVKPLYEDGRVARTFGCDAGKSVSALAAWKFYEPAAEDLDGGIDGNTNGYTEVTGLDGEKSPATRGIVLSEGRSYPEMDDPDDVPEVSDDGDKYPAREARAECVVEFTLPVVIEEGHGDWVHVFNGHEGYDGRGEVEPRTLETAEEVKDLLSTTYFSGLDMEEAGPRTLRFTGKEGDMVFGGSLCEAFGIAEGSRRPCLVNRILNDPPSVPGYEAWNLLVPDGGLPGWRYSVDTDAFQSVVFDLVRAPLLMKERGWRYTAGDSENPSDGIKTYFYDRPFSENCLVFAVELKPSRDFPCDAYHVSGRRSGDGSWTPLFSCARRPNGTYVLPGSDDDGEEGEGAGGTVWFYSGKDRLLDYRYVKVECESRPLYVYRQYEIDRIEGTDMEGNPVNGSGYQVVVRGDFSEYLQTSIAGLAACVGGRDGIEPDYRSWASGQSSYGKRATIVAAQVFGVENDRMRVFLDAPVDGAAAGGDGGSGYLKFFIRRYAGGIDRIRAIGIPYKTEKGDDSEKQSGSGSMYLTKTGGHESVQATLLGFSRSVPLPVAPSEIARVCLDSACGVTLTETDSEPLLAWKTETRTVSVLDTDGMYADKSIRVIVGGTYLHVPAEDKILLPENDQDGISWRKFESAVEGYQTFRSYLPSSVTVLYCDGNGRSVTLPATADGDGPSYMVEKGAVNEIVNEGGGKSLLSTGRKSCRMINPNALKEGDDPYKRVSDMAFTCSNDIPAGLSIEASSGSNSKQGTVKFNAGEFRLPAFTGKELMGKANDDQVFIDLFGEEARNCRGKCTTEVTFTGPADYVLSGHITVRAPATTKRAMAVGDKTVEYFERTGGIKQGFMVVKCAPSKLSSGRMTKCYSLPTLLVYAKERQPYTER